MENNTVSKINQQRLALFSVCSHVDKPLLEEINLSKYEIPIQGGAALTSKRICTINDCNYLADNISDRNPRYSELSAIYWIWKKIHTPYIGICHYRRKYIISDRQLEELMDNDIDIITLFPASLQYSIKESYKTIHYTKDWDLIMNILEEKTPEYYNMAREVFDRNTLHPCCMGIYKKEVFEECCEWLFPILEEFYKLRPEKADIYQRRDVGFIGERLLSLFIDYNKNFLKYKEVRALMLNTSNDKNIEKKEKNNSVSDTINALAKSRNFGALYEYIRGSLPPSEDLERTRWIMQIYFTEKAHLLYTILEYLPDKWDWNKLTQKFDEFTNIIYKLKEEKSEVAVNNLLNCIKNNGWSEIALLMCIQKMTVNNTKILNNFALSLMDEELLTHAFQILNYTIKFDDSDETTLLNFAYYCVKTQQWKLAKRYLREVRDQDNELLLDLRAIVNEHLN